MDLHRKLAHAGQNIVRDFSKKNSLKVTGREDIRACEAGREIRETKDKSPGERGRTRARSSLGPSLPKEEDKRT